MDDDSKTTDLAVKRDGNGGRDKAGRFIQGNKGGGRKAIPDEVREMLEAASPKAAQRLVEALDAEMVVHYLGEEVGTYVDHRMRLMAAEALWNRLYGRLQVLSGEGGGPIPIAGVDVKALSDEQLSALIALRNALKTSG